MNKKVARIIIWASIVAVFVNVIILLYLFLRPKPYAVTTTTTTTYTTQTTTSEQNVFAAHFGQFKTKKSKKTRRRTTKTRKTRKIPRTIRRTTTTPMPSQAPVETVFMPEFCLNLPVAESQPVRLPPRNPMLIYKYWKEIDGMRKRDGKMWISTNNPKTDTYISGTIHRGHQWEPDIVSQLRRHIRGPGYTFVDVGANIGYFSVLAAKTGARVVSFEPAWENCQRMLHTRKRNNIDHERWAIHCEAVDAVENVRVQLKRNDEAVTTTLDSHFKDTIHLLKIDVEGYEPRVLTGATSLIENQRIKAIILEYNLGKGVCNWMGMEKWLRENRYSLRDMRGQRVSLYSKPKTANVMYIHS